MLNPLTYTEKIVRSFLRYQLTAYPFADERLNQQMRRLLSLEETRRTPLLKGPYISLSRAFRFGSAVEDLVKADILHPHMRHIIPFPTLYGHQDQAIRAIHNGKPTLVSTGTGSGKSECFLYPIISRCLELRDAKAPAGIAAVIVYPMNALAEDQLGRLRDLLAGSGITFGMYVGKTPDRQADVSGKILKSGSSREDYRKALADAREKGLGSAIHPAEEVCSREVMRKNDSQPRILLTNTKQLELLLTRHQDVELFDNATLDFLVFDEAHTFSGAEGAETACLIRRILSFCGKPAGATRCVATSATIVDPRNPDAGKVFASRFFGALENEVVTVNETYEADAWSGNRTWPGVVDKPHAFLEEARVAVDAGDAGASVRRLCQSRLGLVLSSGDWEAALFDALAGNELLYRLSLILNKPQALPDVVAAMTKEAGRVVSDEELIAWLILGAAARKDGRPLLRPVVHAFIRGIPGAVVTFEETSSEPQLLLSAEDDPQDGEKKLRMPVSTCTTCGQHYYAHALADFHFTAAEPGGGKTTGGAVYWEAQDAAEGGDRLILTDRLISQDGEEEEENERLYTLHVCRTCGAAHKKSGSRCLACGVQGDLIPLRAVQQKEGREGYLHRCVCCQASGRNHWGRFREPAKPVRAVNVADVHVLAQDMVHHAERKRLLVFADNRQDAAFQAGWMRDHARRFRLRALMAKCLAEGSKSPGDLVTGLDNIIGVDENLSRALLPEVWQVEFDPATTAHANQRRIFLRYQVLLELTMGPRERIGLEPWGRMLVTYQGLDGTMPLAIKWAKILGLQPDELSDGLSMILDHARRRKLLHDDVTKVFGKILGEGSPDLMNGFLPELQGIPKGIKIVRDPTDDRGRVDQWISSTGHPTSITQLALKWGVPAEHLDTFLKEVWAALIEKKLLVPVTLKGSKDRNLPGCHGVYQVNLAKIELSMNRAGLFRCRTCRRSTVRRPSGGVCPAWRCSGEVEHVPEDADNYDLQLVDGDYTLLRPREHTAMVPSTEREILENIFKGDSDAVNAIVCTQTLEMGVDIGSLDAVLMRNIPPLAANYWQRVGRAGRRHRMAVNVTYARSVNHDRAYFVEPRKMLEGRVDPPSFNLSNGLMISKHVHAVVLTTLHQMARSGGVLPEEERNEISRTLKQCFPVFIRDYLFDAAGDVRSPGPLKVDDLASLIERYKESLGQKVKHAFENWPTSDREVVSLERLSFHVSTMANELQLIIQRLYQRLTWAMSQMDALDKIRAQKGTLDEERKAFYERCDRFVKRMKGMSVRRRREAEGIDDTLTFGVLAAEGFLPGYGLEVGSVVGFAEVPKWVRGLRDFELPRPTSVAVREYVPGNLIYANGQRFVPRHYIRQDPRHGQEVVGLMVNINRQSVVEVAGSGSGDSESNLLKAIPISDVTLVHQSRISDEEENRFQMAVNLFGRDLGWHNGGVAYRWGDRDLQLRKGMRIQLVNVGTPSIYASRQELGYPVCSVCGQSVSPFSSEKQREEFTKNHAEWCGVAPENMGFYADLAVDALVLPECGSRTEAYSLLEALRFAATEVLNMDLEDLQILVIGRNESEACIAVLYDPMPGGSGLLEQLLARFGEIVLQAEQMASDCPGMCVCSCIDCYRTYRNAGYHKHLDRHEMIARLASLGSICSREHDLPPKQPMAKPDEKYNPVGEYERRLRDMLIAAGFPDGRWQEEFPLPPPFGSTTPDCTYDDPHDAERKIFIYLDGLSAHIHGNPMTRHRDSQIRGELRADGHEVLEIPANHLDDRNAMVRHFKRLSRFLKGNEAMQGIVDQADVWFEGKTKKSPPERLPFIHMVPTSETAWVNCVPLTTLKAAAGAFSEDQEGIPQNAGWIEDWVSWDKHPPFEKGMFIAQVIGKSMEPRIPDGSYCLFRNVGSGTRVGKVLLVWHEGIADPEHGGRYTVKVYDSDKEITQKGWRHARIKLRPLNPNYPEIILDQQSAGEVRVIGELAYVLPCG